jgi:hypothetical protein
MSTQLNAARTIGVLFLVQGAGGAYLNFGLLQPVFSPPGFLEKAAAYPTQMGIAALLGIALGVISLGVVIAAWPIFSRHSQRFALWVLAVAAAGLALSTVESATVLSLRSLSEAYHAPDTDAALFTALRGMAAATRNWAHFTNLIAAGLMLLSFHALLYRFALVPRLLAGLGILGALCQLTSISMPFFGRPVEFALLAPLGLAQLALALWLLVKGFRNVTPALGN